MKKIIFFVVPFILLVSCGQVINNTSDDSSGDITTKTDSIGGDKRFKSDAISKNLLGESGNQLIHVWLPPSYSTERKNYPVLYFLTGFSETVPEWSNNGFYSFTGTAKTLMENKTIKEYIIVIISGTNRLWGSFYVNSKVMGNWEDYVTQEVINYVDTNYRTIATKDGRGIAGQSMGGFGAFNLAMKHPDIYSLCYIHNPGLFNDKGIFDNQLSDKITIAKFLENQNILKSLNETEAKIKYFSVIQSAMSNWDFYSMFMYAYGAAFCSKDTPPYTDHPLDKDGNIVNETLLNEWNDGFGNLDKKVVTYKSNLLSLKGIFINYGKNDHYQWIPRACQYLSQKLTENGISHKILSDNGDHESNIKINFKNNMLPFFSDNF
ncbi:MAG: hypothetical protein A2Y34_04745 [Spirochaetes bacterium GWC1_27_15]|nr:MAG: hypothetical protein A2Z98_03735 [Spirochaetes bacterium GWB1_27_13]OHD21111.1 MAG: hypothetical protein A2Y34_04745 [Spirochaetes bacterium GWC1_27_15]